MRNILVILGLCSYLVVNASEIPSKNFYKTGSRLRQDIDSIPILNMKDFTPEVLKLIESESPRRRFLYALNFQKGVLSSYSSKKSLQKHSHGQKINSKIMVRGKSLVSSNSLRFPKSPSFSSRILMSYRSEGALFSNMGFKSEVLDLSDRESSGLLTVLGIKKDYSSIGSLDMNFFLRKYPKSTFRLGKLSFSYRYSLIETAKQSIVPQLTVFIPTSSYKSDVTENIYNGSVVSSSFHWRTSYFRFADINYGFYYYYHSQDISKNALVNSFSLERRVISDLNLIGSISHFASGKEKGMVNSSLTACYSYLLNNLRHLKVAGTIENKSMSFDELSYALTVGLNY